jgi:microsomal dipeptidase-like Zn-dependent dipeptidase
MTSPRRVPIFDGHNDVLFRLLRRGGTDAPRAFLEGEGKGQLDFPMARQGGFAGGLFAIFVPSANGAIGPNAEAPSQNASSGAALPPALELMPAHLRPDGRQHADTPVDLVIEHLEHILKHVGEDGVGFGSDFDGAKVPTGVGNAAGLQNLVEIMRRRGYGEPLIEKLCHRNWLRVLGQTWGRAHTP